MILEKVFLVQLLHPYFSSFFQGFSLSIYFSFLWFFSHLSLSFYPIYRIFVLWEKKLFVVEIDHLVVNPPTLCYPSYVEVDFWSGGWLPLLRGGDCWLAPSSERWSLCWNPSSVR